MKTANAFCDDSMMAYDASRRVIAPGDVLTFDDGYRLAHLPLVAPGHPDIIRSHPGRDYINGRYAMARYSLVLPIDASELVSAPEFQALERDLHSSAFADKINWDMCTARAANLHATVFNGLAEPDMAPCIAAVRSVCARVGPGAVRLGGPFLGNKNTGRIYFPVYPQRHGDDDILALVQDACGITRTRFYVVGYYHFNTALNVTATAELARIIAMWRHRTLAEIDVMHLAIQATHDDLALSAQIVSRMPFG
jgi:hypothetical protein